MSGGRIGSVGGTGESSDNALYILTIYRHGVKIGSLHLVSGAYSIGRLDSCAICLDDDAVSRMHANLTISAEGAGIEDMGSANGVIWRSQRVRLAEIEPGERLGIPPFELELTRIERDAEGEQHTVVDRATEESTRILPPPRVELRLVKGSAPQNRYTLEFGQSFIGRGAECDIFLPEPHVSRRHAVFELGHDSLVVRDLGSTVGTYVGGQRIEQTTLGLGDRVLVGNAVFEVHSSEGVALLPAREAAGAVVMAPALSSADTVSAARPVPVPRSASIVNAETVLAPVPEARIAPTAPELPSLRMDSPLLRPLEPEVAEMETAAAVPAPLFTPTAMQEMPGYETDPEHDEHDAETKLQRPAEPPQDSADSRPPLFVPPIFDASESTLDASLPWQQAPNFDPVASQPTHPELPAISVPRRSAVATLGIVAAVLVALGGLAGGVYLLWGEALLSGAPPQATALVPSAVPGTSVPTLEEPAAPTTTDEPVAEQPPADAPGAGETPPAEGAGDGEEPAVAAAIPQPDTPEHSGDEPAAAVGPTAAVEPGDAPDPSAEPAKAVDDDRPVRPRPPRSVKRPAEPRPAVPVDTSAAQALLDQGLAEAERGERVAAVRTLQKAAAAAPHGAIASQARERSDEILAALQQEVAPLLAQAQQQEESDDLAEAAATLRRAQGINPFDPVIGRRMKKLASALDPQVEQLFDAGMISLQLGKQDEACSRWRQAEPLCLPSSPFQGALARRLQQHCQ
ncbi:MAG: FHA domain-containing protein [Pseudomonadota bacterium]